MPADLAALTQRSASLSFISSGFSLSVNGAISTPWYPISAILEKPSSIDRS